MHKAKTSRLPKLITSLLAVFALVLGGSMASLAPANAVNISACQNSAQHYNDCQASPDITMTVTPATYTVAPGSLAAGVLANAKIVKPSAIEVLLPTPGGLTVPTESKSFLTLQTGTPVHTNTSPLIVWFELIRTETN